MTSSPSSNFARVTVRLFWFVLSCASWSTCWVVSFATCCCLSLVSRDEAQRSLTQDNPLGCPWSSPPWKEGDGKGGGQREKSAVMQTQPHGGSVPDGSADCPTWDHDGQAFGHPHWSMVRSGPPHEGARPWARWLSTAEVTLAGAVAGVASCQQLRASLSISTGGQC